MHILAIIALVWLVCLLIGAVFHTLGSLIWIAILASVIAAIYGYIQRDKTP